MASQLLPPGDCVAPVKPRLSGWIVSVVALAVLIIAAIGWNESQAAHAEVARGLSGIVRGGVADGSAFPCCGGGAFALWVSWQIARTLTIFAAFMVIEVLLTGSPSSWRFAILAVVIQSALGLSYYFAHPLISAVIHAPVGWEPLVRIQQEQLPGLLALFTPVLLAMLAWFVMSFAGFWPHRAAHRFAFLWRFHAVHHSIEDLDSPNAVNHPVDAIMEHAAAVLLGILIGFQYDTVIWMVAFDAIHDRLLHTRAPIDLGILSPILLDNRHHFLHHTIEDKDAGHNFGAMFTIPDRLFGTYKKPTSNKLCETGLSDKLPPRNIVEFAFGILKDRPR